MSKELLQSAANLDNWLDSWKDSNNGIHGYIIHRHMDLMHITVPNTWGQSAAILGHLTLYEKTKDKKWIKKAIKEAQYLVDNYIWEKHFYRNSCYEHNPGSGQVETTLIHNAYPSRALLELCKILKKEKKNFEQFFKVAEDNIKNMFLKRCWNTSQKTILRMINDKDTVIVPNMASSAINAILSFVDITQENELIEKYCIPTIDSILKLQRTDGAYLYDNTQQDATVLYAGITMQGIISLYKKTNEQRYLDSLKKSAEWLIKQIDPETSLFYHRMISDKLLKYPEFVAGSLVVAHQIKRLEEFGLKYPQIDKVIESVLKRQHKSGGIETFFGFTDVFMPRFYPPEPHITKWRDTLPVTGWNALAFDSITYFLPEKCSVPEPNNKFPIYYANNDYIIKEEMDNVFFYDKNDKSLVKAKWIKNQDTWVFGTIHIRTKKQRLMHSLFIWKNRFFFLKPFLNKIHAFRISEKPNEKDTIASEIG